TVHSLSHLLLFSAPPPTLLYTLSLHDALPISLHSGDARRAAAARAAASIRSFSARLSQGGPASLLCRLCGLRRDRSRPEWGSGRSEEHTSELQSRFDLVCRLLLEKKNPSVVRI